MRFVPASTPPGAMTLEAKWYTSPAVFADEAEQIFGRRWICAGRTGQLRETGDFFLTDVAGESIIVTRDEAGTVRAYYNVCRHRGTRLALSEAGCFKNSIQCPYHAWTYALSGELRSARNMEKEEHFDKAGYALHPVAVHLFEGFIFINLAPQPEPFEEAYDRLIGRFSRWNIGGLQSGHRTAYELNCNWKLVFLNYSECYHCPLLHPQLEKLSPSESGRNDLIDGPFLGGYSELRSADASLTTSGHRGRAPIGTLAGEDLSRVYYYTIFPSLLLSLHADYVMVHYVTPISPEKTRVVCEWLFAPLEIALPGFDPMDAVEFWDLTNRQDWRVNELTQRGISSRAYTPGPYTAQEGLLHAFDRYYLRVMQSRDRL